MAWCRGYPRWRCSWAITDEYAYFIRFLKEIIRFFNILISRLAAYYSSFHERLFLENLEEDLESFLQTTDDSSEVLVLPPLSPRYRYLTHNLVQSEFSSLRSVSIGSDEKRRTVIFLKQQAIDSEKAMSTANVGNLDKKNLSIGRGRGKRNNQHQPTTQIGNDTSGSKSESQSKIPDKARSTRVSRGRGWKRPDQAIYIPKALRNGNNDRRSTKDTDKYNGNNKVCQIKQKDEGIFSESDSLLEQKGASRQSLTRQYPDEEEIAVSVAPKEDQKRCDITNKKGTEPPVDILSESSVANDLSGNETESLDMYKNPVDISDINQECCKEKNMSENEKVEEEQTEEILSTEDDTYEKPCAELDDKEKEETSWKNESEFEIETACPSDQIQVIDTCQSMPPVSSCVQSSEEQKEESTKLDQEKSGIDTCQSSSFVESDNTKNEEEILLKVQDMQDNVKITEQQECLTTNTSLVLENTFAEGESEQIEESESSEENKLAGNENKEEEKQIQGTNIVQSSSSTDADLNTEVHDEHDISTQEDVCTLSLEEDAALDNSKLNAMNDKKCLPKETFSHVFNNVLMDLKDEQNGILKENSEQIQIENKSVNFKNEVISEQSDHAVKEVTSKTKNSSENDEILSQNTEDQREFEDFEVTEAQGSTRSEQLNNISASDVGNKEKEKVDSDEVVNNEKRKNEKESKHKKKSKKKKGEEDPNEEKKKKKSKKKENEDEEPKEKENQEKHKMKKKEKKKASKEESGTKSKDSKSREKAKEKKVEKCKNRNEGNGDDDESWESKFNEDGECLDPELLEELTEVTGIKKPSKRKTQFDYYALLSKEVPLDEDSGYGHILELYDFSPELKTQDLVQLLSSFKSQGYEIKWVDDTHALAVFSSEIAAKQAIQMCSSPIMKLRPVSQGTSESKSKAKNCCSFLQPYKPRPQTTKLAAHRLVTGALGVRSTMTKEEREREREKIKEAKEQKRQEKQRKADIWGD